MKKSYELTLPEGYVPILTVDAKDKKTALILNVISAILTVVGCVLCFVIFIAKFTEPRIGECLIFLLVMLSYIVLHELVHGVAYKLLTGRKLTFGVTLTVAYCGVPDIFVYRKPAMISLLAPFTVFTAVFLAGACLLPTPMAQFGSALMLALHIGGCAGDLYDTWLYLTKLRDPSILMQDTGPKQTFYGKTTENR